MHKSELETTSVEPWEESARVTLPVVANAKRLFIFAVVLVLVGAISFAGGMFVRAPQQSALDVVDHQVEVSYAVEERVVAPGFEFPGRVVAGAEHAVVAVVVGAEHTIVTRQSLGTGDIIKFGALLGEVSGRPQIAIPQSVPLYRDLVDGSTGSDVAALQAALIEMGFEASVTSEVGPRTLAAVAALYEGLEVVMSSREVITWTEFVPVPPDAVVTSAAPVGTVLSDDTPLATVKAAADVIVARANVLEADALEVGQVVQVRAGGVAVDSTVIRIGDFSIAEDGTGSGRDIFVEIPADFDVVESKPVTVSSGTGQASGPAVPLVALRQDSSGTYVELQPAGVDPSEDIAEKELPSKVYVIVTAQSEGWAAIEPDEQLSVGTKVRVSQ